MLTFKKGRHTKISVLSDRTTKDLIPHPKTQVIHIFPGCFFQEFFL